MPSRVESAFVGNPPVAAKDAARTFTESNLTLTTGLIVSNESLSFGSFAGTTVSREADDNQTSNNRQFGITIEPTVPFDGLDVTVSGNTSSLTALEVQRASDGTVVYSDSGLSLSGGDTYRIPTSVKFDAGEKYGVYGTNDGATYGVDTSPNFPHSGDDVNITDGWDDGVDGTYVYTFVDVTPVSAASSRTAYVEWPYPSDVYAWDVAQFTRTPDGETVDVYIEEDQSGGWTEVAGPISRGDKIPAVASNNIRYRVEVSRADTSNSPTLDSIYRRWKL